MDFGAATQLLASAARPDTTSARHAGQPSSSRTVAGPAETAEDISTFITPEVFQKAPQEAFRLLGEFAQPAPEHSAVSTATSATSRNAADMKADSVDAVAAAKVIPWCQGQRTPASSQQVTPQLPAGSATLPQMIKVVLNSAAPHERVIPIVTTSSHESASNNAPLSLPSSDSGRSETVTKPKRPRISIKLPRKPKPTKCEVCMKVFQCASKVNQVSFDLLGLLTLC
jgi:hypothetical protein